MSTRYFSNLTLALIAGFVVVASQAFSHSVFASLGLAGGAAAVAIVASDVVSGERGATQRVLDGLAGVIGAALIVTSLVFATSTFVWLGLGGGLILLALGLAGLTVHELKTERVVHSIDVREQPARERIAA